MSNYGDKAKLTINPQAIRALLSKKVDKKIKQLSKEFVITLESPVFFWESTTKRKSGEIVKPGLRNADDLGTLKRSIRTEFYKSGTASIKFTAPYSGVIFDHAKVDLIQFTLQRMRNS